ncbi:MAG: CCA tRNA nucleotidyltransferase [Actinomycetota bacterium]|nr:CCA tRNA nucleotidyltransferase [Actinomycetota bacterium]
MAETNNPQISAAQRRAVSELVAIAPVLDDLAAALNGYEVHLVGGSVRDALLGRLLLPRTAAQRLAGPGGSSSAAQDPYGALDLDVTTNARPADVLRLVEGLAEAVWTTGIEFGTVGIAHRGWRIEITTYRADTYDRTSRNPDVRFGTSLAADLARRDFTINAMAFSLGPDRTFTDPYGGLADLVDRRLRTPSAPEDSLADDPLRMMRAVRFVSQLDVTLDPALLAAITGMSAELARITPERLQAELSKLLLGGHPRRGLEHFVSTGLADVVLPEFPALQMEIDEHHQHKDVYTHSLTVLEQAIAQEPDGEPDLVLRLAALLHDIGKPATRRHEPRGGVSFHHHEVVGARLVKARLSALRYPKQVIEDVSRLTYLHLRFHGFSGGEWTDSAVRRYVTDAGPLLSRLHKLVRSDSTTRNSRRARALADSYDLLEQRIAVLLQAEDLARVRPDLDGNAIMELLDIPAGPLVGKAWRYLKELRMDRGPLTRDEAEAELLRWWAEQPKP